MVGNKCDLETKRQVTFDQGKELARQHGIHFLETSAKDTVNIDELFASITKDLLDKQSNVTGLKRGDSKKEKPTKSGKNINLEKLNAPVKKSGGCCSGGKKKEQN